MPPSPSGDAAARDLVARPLRPHAQPSHRPWAGGRLGSGDDAVGELWLAGPDSVVDTDLGPMTLDAVAERGRRAFVGRRAFAHLGGRFPLLVKLIDAGSWLSLQVHPDDALAAELYGPRTLGKAEAWVVLEATADAELVTGPGEDLSATALRAAITAGDLDRDRCQVRPGRRGEALFLAPGTVHAIGAGCFVYEIEQPSDITFRISDWGRPETPDRPLHRAESLRAVDPTSRARVVGRDWSLDGGALVAPQFQLEILEVSTDVPRRPAGQSLEVVTAVAGRAEIIVDGWVASLDPYETIVIPAAIPAYRIAGGPGARVCIGSVP